MKYQAVIFDLFGTLVKNFPQAESNNVLRRMAGELLMSADEFTVQWNAAFDDRMKGILKDYQSCIRHICQQLGAEAHRDKIDLAASMRFEMNTREVTTPREGAVEVLIYLKSKGYKTGLISNCSRETTLVWGKSPLARFIDVPVFSCVEGTMKPDPHIFHITVDRLAVKPKECLYVADGIGQELATASNLGMYAVLIRAPGESDYDSQREKWSGPVIASLKEVLDFL